MTNMQPQRPALNRGPWSRLEEYSRERALEGSVLFIVAGGIYAGAPEPIGPAIAVPASSYKIVVITDSLATVGPSTEVVAVILPNDDVVRRKKWQEYQKSIDEVEARSGYDFLTSVPTEVQVSLERQPHGRSPMAGLSPAN
jgi:endonuclease G, mitochondrial